MITLRNPLFYLKTLLLIILFINNTSAGVVGNCTNSSFFRVKCSADIALIKAYYCKSTPHQLQFYYNAEHGLKSCYSKAKCKALHHHAHYVSLEYLILGYDDDSDVDEEHVHKKTKSGKRNNRSGYVWSFLDDTLTEIDELLEITKCNLNFYKNPFHLDVIAELHLPPPQV
jgi:hypothetical protein